MNQEQKLIKRIVELEEKLDALQHGITELTLDDAWKSRLLDGSELERDEIGCAWHHALPKIDDCVRINELLKVFDIEWDYGTAESEMPDDAYEEMVFGNKEVDYRKWTPKMPDGGDWKLVAIFDTDYGPVCWWVRAAKAKQGEQA